MVDVRRDDEPGSNFAMENSMVTGPTIIIAFVQSVAIEIVKKMSGISRYMRDHFGFFPTNGKNDAEWAQYQNCVTKVTEFLKSKNIVGRNARANFHEINEWVVNEAKVLYQDSEPNTNLHKLLPTTSACESFLYAVVFAVMGSYDAYRRKV
jgi:hypothetical protein